MKLRTHIYIIIAFCITQVTANLPTVKSFGLPKAVVEYDGGKQYLTDYIPSALFDYQTKGEIAYSDDDGLTWERLPLNEYGDKYYHILNNLPNGDVLVVINDTKDYATQNSSSGNELLKGEILAILNNDLDVTYAFEVPDNEYFEKYFFMGASESYLYFSNGDTLVNTSWNRKYTCYNFQTGETLHAIIDLNLTYSGETQLKKIEEIDTKLLKLDIEYTGNIMSTVRNSELFFRELDGIPHIGFSTKQSTSDKFYEYIAPLTAGSELQRAITYDNGNQFTLFSTPLGDVNQSGTDSNNFPICKMKGLTASALSPINSTFFWYYSLISNMATFERGSVPILRDSPYDQYDVFAPEGTPAIESPRTYYKHVRFLSDTTVYTPGSNKGYLPSKPGIFYIRGLHTPPGNLAVAKIDFLFDPAKNPYNIPTSQTEISLKVSLQNYSKSTSYYSLKGVVRSLQDLEMIDANLVFNNLQENSTVVSDDEIIIKIPELDDYRYHYSFEIELTDPLTDQLFTLQFSLPVYKKPYYISKHLVDDDDVPDSQGDGDGTASYGEIIEILPKIAPDIDVHNALNEFHMTNRFLTLYNVPESLSVWDGISGVNSQTSKTEQVDASTGHPNEDFVVNYNYSEVYEIPLIYVLQYPYEISPNQFIDTYQLLETVLNEGEQELLDVSSVQTLTKNTNLIKFAPSGRISLSSTLGIEQILLHDYKGRQLQKINTAGLNSISLKGLASGVYIATFLNKERLTIHQAKLSIK